MSDSEFEAEMTEHYPDLLKMAQSRLRSHRQPVDLAHDVVQQVMTEAWARREHMTAKERLRAYFVIGVLNRVQSLARDNRRQQQLRAQFEQEAPWVTDPVERREDEGAAQLATLDRLLPEIPDHRARTALYLMARWGLSLSMAAEIMGVDAENLRKREYARAVEWLREQLVPAV